MNSNDKEESLTLGILKTIEQNNDLTQRHLASHLGVALGLANAYLKRCVRKGLVKIHEVPANRYLYYLTPKGFAEKSRLTAKYLSVSFDFYRDAGMSLTELFRQCEQAGHRRLLFCGVSELAEIASIRAQEHPLEVIGLFDPNSDKSKYLGLPVWNQLPDTKDFDACVLTALNEPLGIYELLKTQLSKEKIFVPSILGITDTNEIN